MTEQEEEQPIARAFNVGYQMQQHEPELLAKILHSNNQDNQYIKAMAIGKETQEQERKTEQELKKAREKIVKQQKQIRELKKTKKRGR